uniref:Uncharacterized protein n=2 Tax=Meloidogyne TaxID=189290 RepID=A0A915NTF1_9BILA
MTEDKQLFLFGHTLPGNENLLLERIKECTEKRNKGYCSTLPGCTVLRKIPAEDVLQVTAGHNYVAFLLKVLFHSGVVGQDHRVARLRYEIVANTIESPTDKNESGPGSSTAPATTTAAMRRGVFDVLPADALINLTAEDMRLILCGSQDINLQIFQCFTKFFDESSAPTNVLAKYKL